MQQSPLVSYKMVDSSKLEEGIAVTKEQIGTLKDEINGGPSTFHKVTGKGLSKAAKGTAKGLEIVKDGALLTGGVILTLGYGVVGFAVYVLDVILTLAKAVIKGGIKSVAKLFEEVYKAMADKYGKSGHSEGKIAHVLHGALGLVKAADEKIDDFLYGMHSFAKDSPFGKLLDLLNKGTVVKEHTSVESDNILTL